MGAARQHGEAKVSGMGLCWSSAGPKQSEPELPARYSVIAIHGSRAARLRRAKKSREAEGNDGVNCGIPHPRLHALST